MKAGEIPSISLPTRTKYNIEFDDASEVWKYGDKESMRTAASAKSATHLLKMAYVIGFIKQQLEREPLLNAERNVLYLGGLEAGEVRCAGREQFPDRGSRDPLRCSPGRVPPPSRRERGIDLRPDADPGRDPARDEDDPLPGRCRAGRVHDPEQCGEHRVRGPRCKICHCYRNGWYVRPSDRERV